jgi:hypothetical protein
MDIIVCLTEDDSTIENSFEKHISIV